MSTVKHRKDHHHHHHSKMTRDGVYGTVPMEAAGGVLVPIEDDSEISSSDHDSGAGDQQEAVSISHHAPVATVTRATYIYALCAAINSANIGYDVGVNTQAGPLVQEDLQLTVPQLEFFLGSINLFAMVGALTAHFISDAYGRRASFITAAVFFIFGVLVVISSKQYEGLMLGRAFVGLGVGFGLAIDSLYIAEISPAHARGQLVTWAEIGTNIGVLLGFASGFAFEGLADGQEWRYMVGVGTFLPVLMIFLALYVMPESPRWLIAKGRVEDAQKVLHKTYPPGYDVDHALFEMRDTIEKETRDETKVGWSMIFCPTPAIRRMLLVGLGTAIAQQAVGIDALQYFMLFIIEASGITSPDQQTWVLVGLGVVKLTFAWIGGQLFDGQGRRKLFFISLWGMVFSFVVLALDFSLSNPRPDLAILGLALYLATFSIGMGPGAWLVPSEVFCQAIRAKAMSMATFLNRVFATIAASTVLSIADALTWTGYFLMLLLVCLLVIVFIFVYLPETKGRSLEDMTAYFAEITGDHSILSEREEDKTEKQYRDKDSPSDVELTVRTIT